MLELQNIHLADAGVTSIHPTNLALMPGEFSNLLGATLSGKTTLMRLMAGLEKPSDGALLVDGEDVTGRSVRARDVSMVYQQFVNYPAMNVFDNIASPLCASGRPPRDLKNRVGEVAELLRISDLLQRMPNELSGGQQQRTAIARTLVRNAKLVLLDEPLANLDYKLREELREELPRLFAKRNSVIVYATTEPSEALLMGGNAAALHEGRVVQFGRAADVYHNPQTLLAARIFSNPPLNEMSVTARDNAAVADDAGVTMPLRGVLGALANARCRIAFRPHHLQLGSAPAGGKDKDEWVSLRGKIIVTEISGSESFIHVRVGACKWVAHAHQVVACANNELLEMHVSVGNFMVFTEAGDRLEARNG